jgi:D-alanyl-D-alanine carboxypeptidase/D-alanyl-D-alanine-endopeptidase (penicillin-binding protein 4)
MTRQARRVLLIVWLLVTPGLYAASPRALPQRIAAVLSQPDLASGFLGIEVMSASDGRVLYSQNADKLFTPASNTKLFTTAAALALVGPDYKFRTTVEATGEVDRRGRLSGDLVLVGRGDPNLSGRELPYDQRTQRSERPLAALEQLADTLAQEGLKVVDGDVVADDSYFAFERYGEGWSQDDLMWGDGAPVSALTLNDNVLFVSILPAERIGEPAFVSLNPFADYYRIDNRIITTAAGTARKFFLNREPGGMVLSLWGNLPLDDKGASEALAIEEPAQFAAQVFRAMLEKRGIAVYGKDRTRHTELASLTTFSANAIAPSHGGDAPAPHAATAPLVLASYNSRPLSDDVRVINKVSQNLHAEILLRLIGRERGSSGSVAGGLEAMQGLLTQAGVPGEQYSFHDGSGLSRLNLVSPHAVVLLLRYASSQPWGELYRDSLPVAGTDGSLADRLKNLPPRVRVSAKTGSLTGVKALSGYATTAAGETIVFSILSNNFNLPSKRVTDTIDHLVEAMVNDVPAKPAKAGKRSH